ncbi:MAG TPA: hypothetical protein PLX02_07145 [Syntrophorhabdaceae bacterium]|nr:hypothetical protein [Syntrophorhabdaceae bacterium]HQM81381.1 hypothetical protein [Syntrophorhabdaceae bacterium]
MPSLSEVFYENYTDQWRQGDILANFDIKKEEIKLAVLATPQCDILWQKAEYYLFVPAGDYKTSFLKIADPNNSIDKDSRDGLVELSKVKLNSIVDHIVQNLNGNYLQRFYYLPPYNQGINSIEHTYLDFQKIFTLPERDCNNLKNKRIFTIRDPFRAQIFTRYVAYLGRIGTPDFEQEDVYSIINNSRLRFRNEVLSEILQKKFTS